MMPIEVHLVKFAEHLTLLNSPDATKKTYLRSLKMYLAYCVKTYHANPIQEIVVRNYLLDRYSKGLDWKTINCDYSALKKYFTEVMKSAWSIDNLPRPKKATELPDIISREEVQLVIDHCAKPKHRVLLTFLYATGMRISEAIEVRVNDIDSHRLTIKVRGGKGMKDRYVDVPKELIELLREYYKIYRPIDRLFYGESIMADLKQRTIQNAVNRAKKRAKIIHDVSPHTFRHCYATHHMENGTNIVYIQKMLGHKSLKTTSIYLHLCVNFQQTTIKHPMQGLNLGSMKSMKI